MQEKISSVTAHFDCSKIVIANRQFVFWVFHRIPILLLLWNSNWNVQLCYRLLQNRRISIRGFFPLFFSADFITDNNKPLQKKGMISAQMDNNNGQSVATQQQQQQQLQQQHTTNSTERSYYNPSRRKTTVYENRASTYNMNRYKNKIIGKHNGCPWRPPNFEYGPGVLGWVHTYFCIRCKKSYESAQKRGSRRSTKIACLWNDTE